MSHMKYIIPKSTGAPIVFGPSYSHAEMAQAWGECESAGFVAITVGPTGVVVACWGESISLGIRSNPEWDQQKILRMIDPYAHLR